MKRLLSIFWSSYQVDFVTDNNRLRNTQFFRGFTWKVVNLATEKAKRKSKEEKLKWSVDNIRRI